MTWKEIQEYIETLNDYEKNLYVMLFDAGRNVYYMPTEVVDSKEISKDPCLFISQL